MLIQPTTDTTALTRTISGGFLTFNCCSLKDNETPDEYQGVTPYPGKAFLLQKQFADKNVLIAGLQETHSREPGISRLGAFWRIVPPKQGPDGSPASGPGGDVEIWVNAQRPWDPEDPATTIKDTHLQITSVGPRFFVLSIAAPWIRLDVLTAHAPHTWDQEAIAKGDLFWEKAAHHLSQRPLPHPPLLILADANTDLPLETADDLHYWE